MCPTAQPVLSPIPVGERIQEIDVLRGFALFGVLAANMRGFAAPAPVYWAPQLWWTGTADRVANALIRFFIDGKFITLFALLFGLGFAVQMERAEARGARFLPVYCRRLGVLLLIGLAHALLLWYGDILLPYALAGFLLLLFRKREQETVFTWAMVAYWVPVLLMGMAVLLAALGVPLLRPPTPSREALARTVQAYAEGGFAIILAERLKELAFSYVALPLFFPRIVGMFLLGMYLWRARIFQNLSEHLPRIRRWMVWALGIGVCGNLVFADPTAPSAGGLALMILNSVGVPALSLLYAGVIILLMRREAWRRRLSPLAAVGRAPLSNYLLQSLVCTTLYYGYGFGLYGQAGPALGLLPTFLIYCAQIALSAWWMRRYRFGPLEWLWRSVTYGRLQPMLALREGQR